MVPMPRIFWDGRVSGIFLDRTVYSTKDAITDSLRSSTFTDVKNTAKKSYSYSKVHIGIYSSRIQSIDTLAEVNVQGAISLNRVSSAAQRLQIR